MLKKSLRVLVVVILMAMVFAPTATATRQPVVAVLESGNQRGTIATMTNGQIANVRAEFWMLLRTGASSMHRSPVGRNTAQTAMFTLPSNWVAFGNGGEIVR